MAVRVETLDIDGTTTPRTVRPWHPKFKIWLTAPNALIPCPTGVGLPESTLTADFESIRQGKWS
jgi:hypothetical protein